MKFNSIIYSSISLAAAMFLAGCSNEDEHIAANYSAVTFEITDAGFGSDSRASEAGYATEFTAGDACGLYIVRNGRFIAENIRIKASEGADNKVTWTLDSPITGGLEGESYFLYYPYQADMPWTFEADKVDDFFELLAATWEVKADQSDYADYTASDLMTSKGVATATADGKLKLTFTMTHRMALAVIEMPETVTNADEPTSVDFTVSDVQPYCFAPGIYRYIVNPTYGAYPIITGVYAEDSKAFTVTIKDINAGSYKTYKVAE